MSRSDLARRLRRDMTEAEKVMWRLLRARQLADFKFRRQEPVGCYIVDFDCFHPRLVVETDGGQHANPTKYEDERARFLEREGFHLLSFWNDDALENREGVCARIVEALSNLSPHPSAAARRAPPPPTQGRGKLP